MRRALPVVGLEMCLHSWAKRMVRRVEFELEVESKFYLKNKS